jgi:WD40 repeat protein
MTQLPDDTIITASDDKTMKLWNMNNFQCIKTIEGNSAFISVVLLPNNNLMSLLSNGINIWDINNGFKCIKTIYMKDYSRFCSLLLLTNRNIAFTAHSDLKMIYCILVLDSANDYTCIKVLGEQSRWLLVNISNNRFASASYYSIKLWDINDDYKCLKNIKQNVEKYDD